MASPVGDLLGALARALSALGVRWYLFGAQAVLLYGGARLTADVDVTVAAGDVPTATLLDALAREGFTARVDDVAGFVDRTRVLPLVHMASGLPLDVVLAGAGLEEAFLARTRIHRIDDVSVPVAAPEDIVAMKLLAGRPKDAEDARAVVATCRLDARLVHETLRALEEALDRSDLVPAFDALLSARRG